VPSGENEGAAHGEWLKSSPLIVGLAALLVLAAALMLLRTGVVLSR
jgi:hypothetical protein